MNAKSTKSRRTGPIIREVVGRVPVDGSAKLKKRVRQVISELPTKEASKLLEETLIAHYQGEELKPYQAEIIKLQQHLERMGGKMIILFDGRDASGKGGTIRRVARYMNEKHYRMVALGKPSPRQRTELHMKRYIEQFPHAGEVVLFDRSWYNRAMIEPIMGFCTQAQYKQFMDNVVSYEESFIADGKTTLLKLYFSVSKEEQARRFERRMNDPLRQWKLSEVDLQAQDLWDEFTEKKFQLLKKTHTAKTPWYVIRSDDKHLARLETMKIILNAVRYRGRSRTLDFTPNPDVLIPGDVELRNMVKQRRVYGKFLY
ncbi:MAG: polyphosphate kinase 2 [Candidatus Latescibacteria bacterium]|nr:polyphosphate kinase 2 [Candidatus Latescibacterota bacterium]MCB9516618.1 polyphosphate kinase 2 [Candidatus Latescibacterota bacterium]